MNATDPRHGSEAGYSAHMRLDRTPCAACREAKNIVNAQRDRYKTDRESALVGGRWEIDRHRRVQVCVPDVERVAS